MIRFTAKFLPLEDVFSLDFSDNLAKSFVIDIGAIAKGETMRYQGDYTVTPNAFSEQILPVKGDFTIPLGYHDGSGKISIDADEKAKLIAANIREGITLLGVEGTMSGSEGMSPQSKTVTPSTVSQTIQPDATYNCLASVTVNAIPYTEVQNAAGGYTATIA